MRKNIIARLLSAFLFLTVVFSGATVNADTKKPNPDNLYLGYIAEVSGKERLYEFTAPYDFSYRFRFVFWEPYQIRGGMTPIIELYDEEMKLIESSDDEELASYLESGKYYVYIYTTDESEMNYSFIAEYDASFEIKVKMPGSDNVETCEELGCFTTNTISTSWTYLVLKGCELTAELKVNNLPSGKYDLSYKYGKNTTLATLPLDYDSISFTFQNRVYVRCRVSDKKSSFAEDFYCEIEPYELYKFEDGTYFDCEIKACKSTDERVSTMKKAFDEKGNSIVYHGFYILNNTDVPLHEDNTITDTVKVDSDCKQVFFIHDAYCSYNYIMKEDVFFVFPDGAGDKVTCNTTYHIDKKINANEYAQVIYSFTPEKDGVYRFASSNTKYGDPMVAVFDSDRKLICFDDDKENDFWDDSSKINDYRLHRNYEIFFSDCEAEAELQAGKTYYVAIPIIYDSLECDFKINLKNDSNDSDVDGLSFDDFVERLYVVALNRQSEKRVRITGVTW